ncbi:ChaB family protein [Microseira wollei]|uniref:ChaB family protein n=1 Tax=Microseira wollei NIES-4236 TaxID=2530354 RepID=A0AAV3X9Q1_9CYAN|nr:ChaB family protein [Microseira wollei]GET38570.1 hypothetical protein MiSe_33280 [Microseira wollei NIES-4236]
MPPYKTNQDLPTEVRRLLSESAQDLYRAAFNCALQWYGDESKAHKVAACAVRIQTVSLNSVITLDSVTKPQIA